MLVGVLLGIALAVLLAALGIYLLLKGGALRVILTGGVIGVQELSTYAIIAAVLGIVLTLYLISVLKKRHKPYHHYGF